MTQPAFATTPISTAKHTSIKRYIFSRISLLALGVSLLLCYQGTQSFLKGIDIGRKKHMLLAAEALPEGEHGSVSVLGYHVASSWDQVPNEIKVIFPKPPIENGHLLNHRENWWYFAPPEKSYSLIRVQNRAGAPRYISSLRDNSARFATARSRFSLQDPMLQMGLTGVSVVLAFLVLLYWTFRNLTSPAQQFYQWTDRLRLESAQENRPDFYYQELNTLADVMQTNVQNVSRALIREQEFLGYASHELRTPITTLRSNITLLDKITPNPSIKERHVRDRILRSSLAMKGITETLLWLSRDEADPLPISELDLAQSVRDITDEMGYLLTDKPVEILLQTEPFHKNLPAGAVNILMGNIIRNAFQHTKKGFVHIEQSRAELKVTNSVEIKRSELSTGFGLGLKLTRKMAQRFDWQIVERRTEELNEVIVRF